MKARELGVWLNDERVATLNAKRPGSVSCRYTAEALERWDGNTPVLSCSLPLGSRRLGAYAFVTGLLPEGHHRQAMAQLAGVTTSDLLGMLERFGRDVAGALIVSAEDPPVRNPSVEPFTKTELEAAVAALSDDHPLGLYDDSELSIAGLADKMLVVQLRDGQYGRPVHGAPSTHILKVDDRVRRGLVRAEHACLLLARAAGLRASSSSILHVGDAECIVVERFDRDISDDTSTVTRIHQEDTCQALGLDPELNQRRGKYEAFGGPRFSAIASLLEQWAADPEAELLTLCDMATFTVAVGNADAHGKNVGLLHPTPGVIELAPLYDTVPTVLWPGLRAEAAMSVAGVQRLTHITIDDLLAEATSWGLGRQKVQGRVIGTLERMAAALERGDVDVDTPALDSTAKRVAELLANH